MINKKLKCAKCGTIWTIHELGTLKNRPPLIGEFCPGCIVWLDVCGINKSSTVTSQIITPQEKRLLDLKSQGS